MVQVRNFFTALTGFAVAITAGLACAANAPSNADQYSTRFSIRSPASLDHAPQSTTPTKKDLLARLQALQAKQTQIITSLDDVIQKRVQETSAVSLTALDLKSQGNRIESLTKQIDELNKKRREAGTRRDLLDRLIFAIDSKWTSQPLQPFLEQQFLEMSMTDLADPNGGKLWKTMTYLSVVVREVPDSHEDILSVIEGYMNFSSMVDPKNPAEYLASRNYTNGAESVTAHQIPRENLGNLQVGTRSGSTSPVGGRPLELRIHPPTENGSSTPAAAVTEPSSSEKSTN